MAFQLGGQTLTKDTAFSANGTMFPKNWLALASPEERKNIGITETPDTPTIEDTQAPIRMAGSVDQPADSTNTDTSTSSTTPTSGPGSDAEWDNFITALNSGTDLFAGERFTPSSGRGITYDKPVGGHGSALRFNRPDAPNIPEPATPTTTPATTPKTPAAAPPAGGSPGVNYTPPAAYQAPSDSGDGGNGSQPDYTPSEFTPTKIKTDTADPVTPVTPAAPAATPTPASTPQTFAMERFVDPKTGGHLYTSNVQEGNLAGLSSEGQAFQLFKDSGQATGASDVYRLFNPTTGDHFYTATAAEKDAAAAAGYRVEGAVGRHTQLQLQDQRLLPVISKQVPASISTQITKTKQET